MPPPLKRIKDKSASSDPAHSSSVTFESLGLKSRYLTALPSHVLHPTPIQALSIPSILASCTSSSTTASNGLFKISISSDVILRAETGSGKTLAMLLPLLQLLDTLVYDPKMTRNDLGTQILYIVPTRELAIQTGNVLEPILNKLTKPHWIISTVLTGQDINNKADKKGITATSSRKAEKARLRKGVCIVIGTPGRLLDHLRLTHTWSNSLKHTCKWIVVDEADRLGDMGFEPLVREIVHRTFFTGSSSSTVTGMHEKRGEGQGLILASATAREDITEYAGEGLRNPIFLNPTSNPSQLQSTNSNNRIKHHYVCVPTRQRLDALIHLLSKEGVNGDKVIVFVSCCDAVDYFYALLTLKNSPVREGLAVGGKNVQVHRLHGRMTQRERLAVLNTFSQERRSSGNKGERVARPLQHGCGSEGRGLSLRHLHHSI